MSNDLRFGVIGCGVIHGNHCDPLVAMEGVQLSAVMDEVEDKAKAAGDKYGVPWFTSLGEFWEHVDAVSICTPSGLHGAVGVEAARHGKHVLTEKPVEITYGAGKALVDACETAGVKHACISQHRFADGIRRTREAVAGGELGKMVQGDAYIKWYRTQEYYDSGAWRGTWELDGGGCLMNQGVHYVDMIQWVMGGVESVQAITKTAAHDIEVEDTACAIVQYKNGAIGVIQGSTSVYPGLAERIEVHGQHGSVIVEGDRIKLWEVDAAAAGMGKYGRGVEKQPTPNVEVAGGGDEGSGAADPTAIWGEQHRMQIQDFVDAIREDRDPFMTCRDALEPLKVILAIYESSRRDGSRVSLEEIGR